MSVTDVPQCVCIKNKIKTELKLKITTAEIIWTDSTALTVIGLFDYFLFTRSSSLFSSIILADADKAANEVARDLSISLCLRPKFSDVRQSKLFSSKSSWIYSIHVLGCLLLLLVPSTQQCTALFGSLLPFIRCTCPNHIHLCLFILSHTVLDTEGKNSFTTSLKLNDTNPQHK